jgi:hypothetical protein
MTRKPESPKRRMLIGISEEMKQWSSMLAQELSGWPQVTSRPMFGMAGFYRKRKIFAALPRSRALGAANAIIFRLDPIAPALLQRARKDARIGWEGKAPKRWLSFELNSAEDLRDALRWLNHAYERAK